MATLTYSSTVRRVVWAGQLESIWMLVANGLNVTGEPLGRIQFELFADVVPKTAENFRQFCTGETKNHLGRPQGYKGSKFHRIVSYFSLWLWGPHSISQDVIILQKCQPYTNCMLHNNRTTNNLTPTDQRIHVSRWWLSQRRWYRKYVYLWNENIRGRKFHSQAYWTRIAFYGCKFSSDAITRHIRTAKAFSSFSDISFSEHILTIYRMLDRTVMAASSSSRPWPHHSWMISTWCLER